MIYFFMIKDLTLIHERGMLIVQPLLKVCLLSLSDGYKEYLVMAVYIPQVS